MAFGAPVETPPRTTWKGTPLHELWLKDPDGTLIEIYAFPAGERHRDASSMGNLPMPDERCMCDPPYRPGWGRLVFWPWEPA